MRSVTSCGVLLFRRDPILSFLLLSARHRMDLPKGHVEPGETERDCALRELEEETGLPRGAVRLEEGYRHEVQYTATYRRFGREKVAKTVVVFLGWLERDGPVTLTEHDSYRWEPYRPPHRFHQGTIDSALLAAERHLEATGQD